MKKSQGLIITCRHRNPKNIVVTPEGESVCRCGVILLERMSDTTAVEPRNSTVSLYHKVENGCDPKDMKVVNKKIHIYHSSASEFSNICSKLNLSSCVAQSAWGSYHQLRSKTYFTRAKCALLSIYVACRESDQAVNESKICEAIRTVFCVKNTYNALSVISEMHEEAFKIGIDTNKGHSSSYYLNLEISQRQHLFMDARDYDRFKVIVMNNFGFIHGNSQNKARRAVEMGLNEMGVSLG